MSNWDFLYVSLRIFIHKSQNLTSILSLYLCAIRFPLNVLMISLSVKINSSSCFDCIIKCKRNKKICQRIKAFAFVGIYASI